MVVAQTIIYYLYMLISALCAYFLIKHLFKRKEHKGIVNDITYAICIIPFILRILQIR